MHEIIRNKPINISDVLDDAKPRGIIHCGAFLAEELPIYESHGIKNVCWIEADPNTFNELKKILVNRDNDVLINVAVCDKNEVKPFYVMDNGASSSLLKPTGHLDKYPTVKYTNEINVIGRKLDSLVSDGLINMERYDFLYMDLQGGEFLALRGFERNICDINYILAEINYEELYEGCMLIDDFDRYLWENGFEKQYATIHETVGWGDAYYKRHIPKGVVKF